MENNLDQTKTRWLILALAALTNTIVVAAPTVRLERDMGGQAPARPTEREEEPDFVFTREQLDV